MVWWIILVFWKGNLDVAGTCHLELLEPYALLVAIGHTLEASMYSTSDVTLPDTYVGLSFHRRAECNSGMLVGRVLCTTYPKRLIPGLPGLVWSHQGQSSYRQPRRAYVYLPDHHFDNLLSRYFLSTISSYEAWCPPIELSLPLYTSSSPPSAVLSET